MFLVQILIPLQDNTGALYPAVVLAGISRNLAKCFGGVTAYSRAPARGEWVDADHIAKDDVIAIEVMVEDLDRAWWAEFRQSLEHELRQKEIVVRVHSIERL